MNEHDLVLPPAALVQEERLSILCVDDEELILKALTRTFRKEQFKVLTARSGEDGLEILKNSKSIGLILSDEKMPKMNGSDFLQAAAKIFPDIPKIILTGYADKNAAIDAINKGGACHFLTKPWNDQELLQLVRDCLHRYGLARENQRLLTVVRVQNEKLAGWNSSLKERVLNLVQERIDELNKSHLELLRRLGTAGEYRDNETGLHNVRVCHFSRCIALELGLPESEADLLFNAAALHDLGKIGIPDSILLKPGKLDDAELNIIRTHCEIGSKIIGDNQSPLLKTAASVALTHHEHWDGAGYPRELKGSDIPLSGRIVAVADTFDALVTERPYKEPWTVAEAVKEIVSSRERRFDPEIVDAFLRALAEITAVHHQFTERR